VLITLLGGHIRRRYERDLIHRDLKPESIFVATGADATGEIIKVLDFGLAKFLPANDDSASTRMTAATQTGMLIGTPAQWASDIATDGDRK